MVWEISAANKTDKAHDTSYSCLGYGFNRLISVMIMKQNPELCDPTPLALQPHQRTVADTHEHRWIDRHSLQCDINHLTFDVP